MAPLTLDDVLPLAEFVSRRTEFFESHRRYLDRYRRVRVGPSASLIFQNRQTIWYKIQEMLRVARLADPARVARELDWYNRLLPGRGRLCAALVLDSAVPLAEWSGLESQDIVLKSSKSVVAARVITSRPEDFCIGSSHWMEFAAGSADSCLLSGHRPVVIEIDRPTYQHTSLPLSSTIRQSLIDDLLLSERDAA